MKARHCTCHPAGTPVHPPRVYDTPQGRWVSPTAGFGYPYKERFEWGRPLHVVALAATLLANRGRVPTPDLFDPGGLDRPGRCECGSPLPPQREWTDAGNDWQRVRCPACGTGFVDEEEFFNVYAPDDIDEDGWR